MKRERDGNPEPSEAMREYHVAKHVLGGECLRTLARLMALRATDAQDWKQKFMDLCDVLDTVCDWINRCSDDVRILRCCVDLCAASMMVDEHASDSDDPEDVDMSMAVHCQSVRRYWKAGCLNHICDKHAVRCTMCPTQPGIRVCTEHDDPICLDCEIRLGRRNAPQDPGRNQEDSKKL
jgi:hypothetical protein